MDLGARPNDFVLADVGTRFVGAMLDGLLYLPVVIPGLLIQYLTADGDGDLTALAIGSLVVGVLGVAIVQWYMIATSGQSIAKRLLGMRIVRSGGSPVNFLHGVVLRSWVIAFLSNVPGVGAIVGLVDAVMIFGEGRRCLHDRIADTIVIKA